MSISFSGSTLTFSDSTTMTTAASLIAGPTGPTGGPGPTGPAGSNASVVTTYGAVGSYVMAGLFTSNGSYTRAGCTAAGACLVRIADTITNTYGGSYNATNASNQSLMIYACGGQTTSLGLSGTWRSMTQSKNVYGAGSAYYNLYVRVS